MKVVGEDDATYLSTVISLFLEGNQLFILHLGKGLVAPSLLGEYVIA